MKRIIIPTLAAAALLAGCSDWTDPENKDFLPQIKQDDPATLASLREFKAGEHPVTMMIVQGTESAPNRQNQHPMAMPDSVDYLLMTDVDNLHQSVAAEVAEVRAAKGTRTLNIVDYSTIRNTWEELKEAASESGHGDEYTEEKFADYCREQTEKQLANCERYGFDGIVASYLGGYDSSAAKPFVLAVDAWAAEHADLLVFFRGYPAYVVGIEGQTLVARSRYILIQAEDAKASVTISRKVREQLIDGVPSDRIILEASVPSIAEGGADAQVGATIQTAAQWVMDPKTSSTVKCDKLGLCASNAAEDYFNTPTYKRIREAIAILNPAAETGTEPNPEN